MIQQSPTERAACPFCGNSHVQLTSIRDGYEAWCKCGASMTAHNPDSRNKVIAKWNARAVLASQAAQPAEADGVERVCAQCKGAIGDLPDGRDPEEFCDTCYEDAVASLATPKAPTSTAAEEGPPCENCGDPVRVGHVVLPYDDVGELHADCANPYSLTVEPVADGPKPCVLVGSPMIHVPLSALATPPAPNDDLRAALTATCDAEIAKYTGTYRSDDDIRFALNTMRTAVLAALKENRRA